MTWQRVKSDWERVRAQMHSKWGKLTDADLSAIGGERDELVRRLQERYAIGRRKAEREAEDFVRSLN